MHTEFSAENPISYAMDADTMWWWLDGLCNKIPIMQLQQDVTRGVCEETLKETLNQEIYDAYRI
jgi:hypothetical protein